mmetsp:Transcript_41035/g.87403  ORF Transcript_41035/g.87403 Transcript_41035/m.87403 type:complete len:324 (+) Transcript_41035:147-1118(+)
MRRHALRGTAALLFCISTSATATMGDASGLGAAQPVPHCLLQRNTTSARGLLQLGGDRDRSSVAASAQPYVSVEDTSSAPVPTGAYAADDPEAALPLRLELYLLLSVKALHEGSFGPLPSFLTTLQEELCKSLGLSTRRLSVLSVRGDDVKLNMLMLNDTAAVTRALHSTDLRRHASVGSALVDATAAVAGRLGGGQDPDLASMVHGETGSGVQPPAAAEQEDWHHGRAIVDIEVLPGYLVSEPTPRTVLGLWQEQLEHADSALRTGTLGAVLERATIIVGAAPAGDLPTGDLPEAARGGSSARSCAWWPLVALLLGLAQVLC